VSNEKTLTGCGCITVVFAALGTAGCVAGCANLKGPVFALGLFTMLVSLLVYAILRMTGHDRKDRDE